MRTCKENFSQCVYSFSLEDLSGAIAREVPAPRTVQRLELPQVIGSPPYEQIRPFLHVGAAPEVRVQRVEFPEPHLDGSPTLVQARQVPNPRLPIFPRWQRGLKCRELGKCSVKNERPLGVVLPNLPTSLVVVPDQYKAHEYDCLVWILVGSLGEHVLRHHARNSVQLLNHSLPSSRNIFCRPEDQHLLGREVSDESGAVKLPVEQRHARGDARPLQPLKGARNCHPAVHALLQRVKVDVQVHSLVCDRAPLEHLRVLRPGQVGGPDMLAGVLLALVGKFCVVRDEFPRAPLPPLAVISRTTASSTPSKIVWTSYLERWRKSLSTSV
ncbi:MAG: hypothetical protein RBG13Loki_3921 [Promethearchaeota archaeon CR_4]|nr:MAG: hypothetical protein RBG13Loki_3921 [Candidatus Lokiarchaeota archaeon CR_4]